MYNDNDVAPECAPAVLPYDWVHTMDVTVTSCGVEKRDTALVTVKSWLLYRPASLNLTLHVFIDDSEQHSFDSQVLWWRERTAEWPHLLHPELVTLHYVNLMRLPPVLQSMLHAFKRCSGARLWAAEVLPHVERLLYVDGDTLLVYDPRRVWAEFALHNDSTMLNMAWEGSGYHGVFTYYVQKDRGFPFYRPWGLNAGVLLMDLRKIRRVRFDGGQRDWSGEVQRIYAQYGDKLEFGDQDVLNIICAEHRELCMPLPAGYNYRAGLVENRGSFGKERGVTIMHGAGGLIDRHESGAYSMYKALVDM